MNKFSVIFLTVFTLFGCSKMEVNENNIIGQWSEEYSAYPYYASEGGVSYDFQKGGTVDIHYYDVFAGDSYRSTTYKLGENTIVLFSEESDNPWFSFNIVKLSKNEMVWQKIGTTFSKGTVGSEFKHLVRR